MTLAEEMARLGERARAASRMVGSAAPAAKTAALEELARLLEERADELLAVNARDVEAARARGLDAPRLDRLTLTPAILQISSALIPFPSISMIID